MKRILVTGAAGFIGHHFIEAVLRTTDAEVVGLDRLDGTSTWHRLLHLDSYREAGQLKLVWHDLKAPIPGYVAEQIGHFTDIVHFAASSHVDRSIKEPMAFVMDNVVGTCNLLDFARNHIWYVINEWDGRFINFSTDEVFGTAAEGQVFDEDARYRSMNPYSASKAGAEELGIAYHNTYGVPVVTTHCSNVFGERQHSEKFIPLAIRKVLRGETVAVHTDAAGKIGMRQYIHARNVAQAVMLLLDKGVPGEKYNIAGQGVSNLEILERIGAILDKIPVMELMHPVQTRPGHDTSYAISGDALAELDYVAPKTFAESFEKTVRWFQRHPEWL